MIADFITLSESKRRGVTIVKVNLWNFTSFVRVDKLCFKLQKNGIEIHNFIDDVLLLSACCLHACNKYRTRYYIHMCALTILPYPHICIKYQELHIDSALYM